MFRRSRSDSRSLGKSSGGTSARLCGTGEREKLCNYVGHRLVDAWHVMRMQMRPHEPKGYWARATRIPTHACHGGSLACETSSSRAVVYQGTSVAAEANKIDLIYLWILVLLVKTILAWTNGMVERLHAHSVSIH